MLKEAILGKSCRETLGNCAVNCNDSEVEIRWLLDKIAIQAEDQFTVGRITSDVPVVPGDPPSGTEVQSMTAQQSASRDGDQSWTITCAVNADEVAKRVHELARQLSVDYAGQELLMVGVLKGAWIFLADLVRQMTIPVHCDFVRLSSYGPGIVTSGHPQLLLEVVESVEGRHLLIVDDLIDTGISMAWLLDHFARRNPASLKLCVLLDKPARRSVKIVPDYVGFEIPDRFVVGYGIDYAEQCRELPYIGYVTYDPLSPED